MKPPGAEYTDVAEVEVLVVGVEGVKVGGLVSAETVESTWALSGVGGILTVPTGEPEGSTKVNTAGAGVLVGRVTGTTKGMPVSAA